MRQEKKYITPKKKRDADQLSQNYEKMNETGKEKLKEVSEKMLDIWNVVMDSLR
jgi:hypothetical protein